MADRHHVSPHAQNHQNWPVSDPGETLLALKMGDFYLHTPTVTQTLSTFPHTPYNQTPGFSPASVHTPFAPAQVSPASAAFATPNSQRAPERVPEFVPFENPQMDISGGLNIALNGFRHDSVDTIPEEDLPRQMPGAFPETVLPEEESLHSRQSLQNLQSHQALQEGLNSHHVQNFQNVQNVQNLQNAQISQNGLLALKQPNPAFLHPMDFVKPAPDILPMDHLSFEVFLLQEAPFTHKKLHSSSNEPISLEELLKQEPFPLEKPISFSGMDDDDDLLSSFFDFDDDTPTKKTPPFSKPRSSKTAGTPTKPPRHKIPTFSAVASDHSSSKQVRKCKSFSNALKFSSQNPAGPAFSFEECSNEFHIAEGNYSFQDETARLSKQLGLGVSNKKNNTKTEGSDNLSRPTLKKSKTTSNICLPRSSCRSPKVLKNMELGLVSFQVKLKNSK